MYRLEREAFLNYPLIALWALLGFQAGFINSFGFLACGRFVSHVTGFGTQIGVAIGAQQFALAVELIGFPLAFITGAAFSGFLTSARLERNLKPHYEWVTLLLPVALIFAALGGHYGLFGEFGASTFEKTNLVLLFILSFICGVQNGCFATMTKGQIRTTHLTGISTDIGTDLARLVFGRLQGDERTFVRRANISRALTLVGFAVGSIASVLATESFQFLALIVPIITSFAVFLSVQRISLHLDQRALSATAERRVPAMPAPTSFDVLPRPSGALRGISSSRPGAVESEQPSVF